MFSRFAVISGFFPLNFFIIVDESFSCSPAHDSDPWFLTEIMVDNSSLPEGLTIENYNMQNSSKIPIYTYTRIDELKKILSIRNWRIFSKFGKYKHTRGLCAST